ncbi:hypothetical protein ZWY2020_059621 [Hordeum vulgare]|nr:hypothetical protein ZWY2020_059621 [Hordeum vulgare]
MNTVDSRGRLAAATEMEVLALDWLAQLRLPTTFMNRTRLVVAPAVASSGTTSEAMLVTLVAAARCTASEARWRVPHTTLAVYAADQTHSTFFKACRWLRPANIRSIPTGPETNYGLDQ